MVVVWSHVLRFGHYEVVEQRGDLLWIGAALALPHSLADKPHHHLSLSVLDSSDFIRERVDDALAQRPQLLDAQPLPALLANPFT